MTSSTRNKCNVEGGVELYRVRVNGEQWDDKISGNVRLQNINRSTSTTAIVLGGREVRVGAIAEDNTFRNGISVLIQELRGGARYYELKMQN